jgi:serine protease Do
MTARLLVTTTLGLLFAAGQAVAQPSADRGPAQQLLAPFRSVVAKANEATVRIKCNGKDAALGTIVFADGFVLTKASELRGKVTVKLSEDTIVDADTVAVHKPTDLALLKVEAKGLKPVTFADSKKIPTGYWLAAAGLGTNPTAVGIVSVITRDMAKANEDELRNQNRGYLNILMSDTDDPDGGAVVRDVPKDGAADKAGLQRRDVIFEINGLEVTGQKALRDILDNYRPKEEVVLKVRRDGEVMEFKAKLGPAPGDPSRGQIQNSMGGELSGRRVGFPAVLQTDMVVDPKNCGGPVVDLNGTVLGISIARAGRVETWILPSETIRPLLAEMKAGKYPPVALRKATTQEKEKDKDKVKKESINEK